MNSLQNINSVDITWLKNKASNAINLPPLWETILTNCETLINTDKKIPITPPNKVDSLLNLGFKKIDKPFLTSDCTLEEIDLMALKTVIHMLQQEPSCDQTTMKLLSTIIYQYDTTSLQELGYLGECKEDISLKFLSSLKKHFSNEMGTSHSGFIANNNISINTNISSKETKDLPISINNIKNFDILNNKESTMNDIVNTQFKSMKLNINKIPGSIMLIYILLKASSSCKNMIQFSSFITLWYKKLFQISPSTTKLSHILDAITIKHCHVEDLSESEIQKKRTIERATTMNYIQMWSCPDNINFNIFANYFIRINMLLQYFNLSSISQLITSKFVQSDNNLEWIINHNNLNNNNLILYDDQLFNIFDIINESSKSLNNPNNIIEDYGFFNDKFNYKGYFTGPDSILAIGSGTKKIPTPQTLNQNIKKEEAETVTDAIEELKSKSYLLKKAYMESLGIDSFIDLNNIIKLGKRSKDYLEKKKAKQGVGKISNSNSLLSRYQERFISNTHLTKSKHNSDGFGEPLTFVKDDGTFKKMPLFNDTGAKENHISLRLANQFSNLKVGVMKEGCNTSFTGFSDGCTNCIGHLHTQAINIDKALESIIFHVSKTPFDVPILGRDQHKNFGYYTQSIAINTEGFNNWEEFNKDQLSNTILAVSPYDHHNIPLPGNIIADATTVESNIANNTNFYIPEFSKSLEVSNDSLEEAKEIEKLIEPLLLINESSKGPITMNDSNYYPNFTSDPDINKLNLKQIPYKDEFKSELKKTFEDYIEQKFISPVDKDLENNKNAVGLFVPHLVIKQADKYRAVISVKPINEYIQLYPTEYNNINEILQFERGGTNFLSVIDLKSAYHSVPYLTFKDFTNKYKGKHKYYYFFFYHNNIKYKYDCLPFGLSDAPSHFTNLMYRLLHGIDGVKSYLDDIIIYGTTLEKHNTSLFEVLNRLNKFNFKIKRSKLKILRKSITALGCIISKDGLKADPNKLKAIRDMPIPQTIRDLRGYIGHIAFNSKFIYFRAQLLLSLYNIIKNNPSHKLSDENKAIVAKEVPIINNQLANTIALSFPSPDDTLHVFTDASDSCLGCVLCFYDDDDHINVVDTYSRTFRPNELVYSVFRKEMLAIISALLKWQDLLSRKPFVIRTDNKGLTFRINNNNNDLVTKLEKNWLNIINEFNYTVIHVAGSENNMADQLSRLTNEKNQDVSNPQNNTLVAPISIPMIDNIPNDETHKQELLDDAHQADHGNYLIMIDRITSAGYNWSNIANDCRNYILSCIECAAYNPAKFIYHTPLTVFANAPFQHTEIDLAGPFPLSVHGFKYVLIYCCVFTGYVVLEGLTDKSKECVCVVLTRIFCELGCPKIVQSDNGGEFNNALLTDCMETIKTSYKFSSSYNPRANGKVETKVNQFKTILYKLVDKVRQRDFYWSSFIKYIQYVLNTRKSSVTHYTPFYLVYGRQSYGLLEGYFQNTLLAQFNIQDWLKNQNHIINNTHDEIMKSRESLWTKYQDRFMRTHLIQNQTLIPGTLVMVRNEKRKTFERRFYGPYVVDSVDEHNSYRLKISHDEDATIFPRKFPRDKLKVVTDRLRLGLTDPIIQILEEQVCLDEISETNSTHVLVHYYDNNLADEWVDVNSLQKTIYEEYTEKKSSANFDFPYNISSETLKAIYSFTDAEISLIQYN